MMNVPDVNVLVALARRDHAHHRIALAWFDDEATLGAPFSVPEVVMSGAVRVLTNPRVFSPVMSSEQVFAFLDSVCAQPTYLRWVTRPDTEQIFRRVVAGSGVTGARISDAYIAALAMTYAATLVTFDRDFRRFDGLRLRELPV